VTPWQDIGQHRRWFALCVRAVSTPRRLLLGRNIHVEIQIEQSERAHILYSLSMLPSSTKFRYYTRVRRRDRRAVGKVVL
jgi:hypothetical protein